jgi:hypothetical protein
VTNVELGHARILAEKRYGSRGLTGSLRPKAHIQGEQLMIGFPKTHAAFANRAPIVKYRLLRPRLVFQTAPRLIRRRFLTVL